MFASPELAARIDRAEGRLVSDIARAHAAAHPGSDTAQLPVAGGVAVFVAAGSPANKLIGAGFDGAPDGRDLERVERAFADRRSPLQAEVSTLADPVFHAQLVRRGYEPRGFENVLGHPLASIDPSVPEGLRIEVVSGDGIAELIDAAAVAWAQPDVGGVGGDAIPPDEELRRWLRLTTGVPGFLSIAARLEGAVAGCAWLRLDDDGVAQFCGAATVPAFRRRGVQSALLRWRLAYARRRLDRHRCDVAAGVALAAERPAPGVPPALRAAAPRAEGSDLDFLIGYHLGGHPYWKIEI